MFIEQGASDQWEKIDNSSVLDGIGTGGSVAGWAGSGTSNTLTNSPITFSGNNTGFPDDATFDTNIILEGNIYHKNDTNTYFGFNPGASEDDTIIFNTAGSERMRIDSVGAVLIGGQPKIDTATKLQVGSNDSGVTSIWSNADDIVFEHNTNLGLTFATPNDAAATIAFADPQSVQAGWIQYLHDVDAMRFGTNGNNERMRIDSAGNVGIGTTDPVGDLHLYGGQQNIVLTNTNADGVAGSTISRIIGQARGYSNNLSVMQSIDFETNATAWYKGDIVFKTNGTDGTDTSVAATERMRITSAGGISFGSTGTAYGTSGQILKSNGNASPTWIDGSAIPGVPAGSGTFKHRSFVDAKW